MRNTAKSDENQDFGNAIIHSQKDPEKFSSSNPAFFPIITSLKLNHCCTCFSLYLSDQTV